MNAQSGQKQPQKVSKNDSLVEQLRDLGGGVGKTIKQDVIGGMAGDALNSLFGTPKSGDMQPGQSISLGQQAPPKNEHLASSAFPRMPERFPFPFKKKEQFKPAFSQEQLNLLKQQESQVAQKINEIRMELKQLLAEIKAANISTGLDQAVDSNVVDPDTYHINFFDRIKTMLQNVLKQIRESRSWMSTQKSKKKQMGYWSQYKKKGTSFGLSHERTVATQVG